MKQKAFSSILILLLVLFIGGVSGAFYLGKSMNKIPKEIPNKTSSISTPIPQPSTETKTKVFALESLNLSFSYPSTWKVEVINLDKINPSEIDKAQFSPSGTIMLTSPDGQDTVGITVNFFGGFCEDSSTCILEKYTTALGLEGDKITKKEDPKDVSFNFEGKESSKIANMVISTYNYNGTKDIDSIVNSVKF